MKKLSIKEINPKFKNYMFNCEESYSYGKEALKKYKDNVVYFRITEKYCFILLKGAKLFFGYKFTLEKERVKRWKNMKTFIKNKGVVLDKKIFELFKRYLILTNLK